MKNAVAKRKSRTRKSRPEEVDFVKRGIITTPILQNFKKSNDLPERNHDCFCTYESTRKLPMRQHAKALMRHLNVSLSGLKVSRKEMKKRRDRKVKYYTKMIYIKDQ